MDFDLSKENIQPLRGGRNVSQLGIALQAQNDLDHQKELMHQKEEYEKLIRTYSGDDPLENWYNYIAWVEQSYPKQGLEGNLNSLLEHCLKLFEDDSRYKEDRRLCKLFIKYIDQQQNPLELYHMMYAQGICRSCADMYKAWAYYYEAASDFQNAHRIFECGKREHAHPHEDLQNAHENLVLAAGQHIIYGPNERDLSEKRQALTSLRTYKSGQVGSARSTSSSYPGTFGSAVSSRSNNLSIYEDRSRSNVPIPIYEDRGEEIRGAEAGPTSIITAAKRQEIPKENTLKPGPWTTIPVKQKQAGHRSTPRFTVHEDSEDSNTSLKCVNFVSTTYESYSDWIVSLTIPEPKDDKFIPMYPKHKVYAEISTECSLEEIRSLRYLLDEKKSLISNSETNQAVQSIVESTRSKDEKSEQIQNQHMFQEREHTNKSFSTVSTYSGELRINEHDNLPPRNACDQNSPHTHNENSDNHVVEGLNFDLWNSFKDESLHSPMNHFAKTTSPKFSIYEQSNVALQQCLEPKGSAMKTPFKDLNAEELAETGSRGGMDIAAAAPVDSAKRLPIYDDESSSSYDKVMEPGIFEDLTCNTQMFCFNLNVMKVSTPQNKHQDYVVKNEESIKKAQKQLFTESSKPEDDKFKLLSTILEETKNGGSSSSSSCSNATTKSSLFGSNIKQSNMATISEEHNKYLAQNLMVNAALRSSSLGDLMDFGNHTSPMPIVQKTPTINKSMTSTPVPMKVVPLNFVPSDPFKQSLIEKLLQRIHFPGSHTQGYCCLHYIPKLSVRKESINIGSDRYVIDKQLGKGTYGTVFRAIDVRTENTVAVKFQKPANKWEFYICRELQARLVNSPLRERFMDVLIGYFSDQVSVLISKFMPCGSLLDVANLVKQKSGRSMKESLCIHFCLEMLKVVQAMHEVKIIHADIKPDNFLVQLLANDVVGLQLIDFGCSIDMSLFPTGASFTRKVTTEDFICCEMRENRPWNYHTDLYCIAATAHVLLFEKYIHLQKKDGHWSISSRLPRYARLDLWNMFFSTLLNQQDGPADSVSLQAMLEDSLNHKFDDYHNELRYLINILKNR